MWTVSMKLEMSIIKKGNPLVAQQKVCLQCRRRGLNPSVRKTLWRRKWQPTPVLLAWGSPWREGLGGLQSMGSQRVRHD